MARWLMLFTATAPAVGTFYERTRCNAPRAMVSMSDANCFGAFRRERFAMLIVSHGSRARSFPREQFERFSHSIHAARQLCIQAHTRLNALVYQFVSHVKPPVRPPT